MKRFFDNSLDAFLWLTECNLATLEELKELKSSSRTRITRQQEICDNAMVHIRKFGKANMAELETRAYQDGYLRVYNLLKGI
jgi:hypothetical protein